MKHIVGLIIMALIVLSLYLAPGAGSWVIGTLGSLGIIAAGFSALSSEAELIKLIIGQSVKDKLKPWQSGLLQLIRGTLFVALVYGLTFPEISVAAKYLLIAGYLALQLAVGRINSYKNTLIRRAYTLKM
ncbi:hypotheticla protein [Erwinia phage vB_EamP-S2]|uniref:Hypotheticla protein n=1 Tax=Erwinia phage vB_EamP-S2 TaxID=2070198 RepID=A0A2K9V4X3_9CAUD|nr:hypotheticla protein [Erwinia phage vB_EamP-S2]AUV57216.1 hypotheticla protein [Erwinia phage vB_EamP-S2]UNA00871.1 hypothetical protein VLVyarbaL_00033 [Erwinia phage VyarbaL]WJN64939.1 hypothetical protein Erwinia_phage_Tapenade_00047 [Erwinia phage Tapenade]